MSWAAAASIGASVVGGMMGDSAASGAAGSQSAAAGQAIDEIRQIGDRTRKDTTPYRNLGSGSADVLSYLLGVGPRNSKYTLDDFIDYNSRMSPSDYSQEAQLADAKTQYDRYIKGGGLGVELDPMGFGFRSLPGDESGGGGGYGSLLKSFSQGDLNNDVVYNNGLKFGLDQGNQAIERNATRFGNLDSGATLKALARFGNDYGTTKAEGAYNRFMGDKGFTLNALLGGTGVGQNAVALDANTGSQMAQAIGGAQMAQGNANAAGQIGSANAWSGALGGIANTIGGGSRGSSFNFGNLFGGGGGYGRTSSAGPTMYQ